MARKAASSKREMLQRTIKWPLRRLTPAQEKLIVRVSDGLREYERWALSEQEENYKTYKEAKAANPDVVPNNKSFLSDFDLYTRYAPLRKEDEHARFVRAQVPANWVLESCFRKVAGAYKSFFALVKRGDRDARTPKPCEDWEFVAIQGALQPSSVRQNKLILAPRVFPGEFEFNIPPEYQAKMLARSTRLAKFIITRDERDLRKPGQFWVSITYEIEMPEPVPFVPEQAVYIWLGASSIGVISPSGEGVIPLWRADLHWKPLTDAVEASLGRSSSVRYPRPIVKDSKKWRKLMAKRRKMFRTMGAQQKQDRREVVAIDLLEHPDPLDSAVFIGCGVHFVVPDIVVRSKEGALADSSKPERGGPRGPNWAAQNTGSLAYLVQWLEEKAREHGGSVRKHKMPSEALTIDVENGDEKKILLARALRDDFLRSFRSQTAA